MDTILKFAALRPHNPADRPELTLDTQSAFQTSLRALGTSTQPRKDAAALADRFVAATFLSQPAQVAHGQELIDLTKRLQSAPLPPVETVKTEVRRILGNDPDAFATDAIFARDSVLARYLLATGPNPKVAQTLVHAYGVADAVLRRSPSRIQLQAIVSGPIALPGYLPPLLSKAAAGTPQPTPAEQAQALATQINTLSAQHQNLTTALNQFQYHAEDELDLSEGNVRKTLIDLYHPRPSSPAIAADGPAHAADVNADVKQPVQTPDERQPISQLLRAADRRNVLFSAGTLNLLPNPVKQTLTGLNLNVATNTVGEMFDRVEIEHINVGNRLRTLSGSLARLTGIVPIMPQLDFSKWALDPVDDPEVPQPVNTTPPATHVEVKPLGVADLLLVRTHIAKYERSEIAHIENTIAHEKLTHEVRRLDRTETTTTTESESLDLTTQAQSIAETDNSHTTVQAVGPGIGPVAAEGPSSFAKSVTDQVSSSSSRRTRKLAELREIHETEETHQHLIDNTAGNTSTYGVYQWLDKVYSAQTFSYGTRLLYDIVVPEPAAVFREAVGRPRSGLGLPTRPAKFTLDSSKLNVDNWDYYATGHHATGVDTPPAEYLIVTEAFGQKSKDQFSNEAAVNTLTAAEARTTRIPRGYRAVSYRARISASSYPAGWMRVSIGNKSFSIAEPNGWYSKTGKLDKETESIPVAIHVTADGVNFGASEVTVGIEIVCQATEETTSAWQVKAHGQILDANRRRFEEYEEAVANRDAATRIFLQSLTPARKATIVTTEMKRTALEVLTAQNFGGFNANQIDAMGFPYPNTAAVAGLSPYIRFFEHAVEWDRVAYAFHPYFWGAQASWVSKLLSAESDRDFARFLTSGSARVIIPIRRGFEEAFEKFLHTGVIPTTDEQLDVGGPLWVSLVNDLQAQSGSDDGQTPVGDPWTFRVASDLVRARPDGSMPKWTLSGGSWTESTDAAFS
ncbi:hypothetical protein [Mycolicibacterium lutetiense]|uniref:Uncharacterized protein n=1 Tax=Mycolicibacterium lutetiense TaxID=1641992 RepID=A0ABS4ZXC3_9MYCO|nr:hypothetical protein [Mycolicibacterium lutetiense]MBP2454172.1 hypothetical protein [Mycolicibacterium lutetiense]